MTILVTGTPDSGKSRYAEDMAVGMQAEHRYYIATMRIVDDESAARALRHRQMRADKGFVTLEIPYRVDEALRSIPDPGKSVILLECISNLAGNEMHENPDRSFKGSGLNEYIWLRKTAADIVSDIRVLSEAAMDLIIVANRYEPEADGYDDMTRLYVALNNLLIDELSAFADRVVDMTGHTE